MSTLEAFRGALRERRRAVGHSQQQLARAIGVHPQVLSRKLNGHEGSVLTSPEVVHIVSTLARWGALEDRSDAELLLEAGGVHAHALPADLWDRPPLSRLPADARGRRSPVRLSMSEHVPAVRISLPAPRTSLVGRERERREVVEALESARLVTLTGTGGTGKTRLALQVALDVSDRFRDGAVFVDLAPVRNPALLASAIAMACGVPQGGPGDDEAMVIAALAERELLLVLDNVEQLVEGVPMVGRLLGAAGRVKVLATSRVRLRVYGERIVRVPPLSLDAAEDGGDSEAVRLFVDRARATGRGLVVDDQAQAAVGDICAALDGLPLAIELAAGQTRFYTPTQLVSLLHSRFALLRSKQRDVPDRQQTVHATLDWSYTLLSPPARRLLAALGVFAGRFDAAAAAAVAGADDPTVLLLLAELSDHSLVEVDPDVDLPYSMFQTVREFALARLAENGDERATHRRNLSYHLHLAQSAWQIRKTPAYVAATAALERANPNIRAAIEFARQQGPGDLASVNDGLQLANAVTLMWARRGMLVEARLTLDRLLALETDEGAFNPAARVEALTWASGLACFNGDYVATVALGERALTLARAIGDDYHEGRVWRFLGEARFALGLFDRVEGDYQLGLRASRRAHDAHGQADLLLNLGVLHRRLGRLDLAATEIRAALALKDRGSDAGAITHHLAEVERDRGDVAGAAGLFADALQTAMAEVDKRVIAACLEGLASIADLRGDHRRALFLIGAAEQLRRTTGARLPSDDQAEVDAVRSRAVEALSSAKRAETIAASRNATLEDVVATVLQGATQGSS